MNENSSEWEARAKRSQNGMKNNREQKDVSESKPEKSETRNGILIDAMTPQ